MSPAHRSALRQGLLSNLANPKMAVFFTSLLPQFAGAGGGASFAAMLALGLAFCSMTLVWLAGYAALVSRAREVFRRSRVRRALEGAMGAVLVGLGVRVAAGVRLEPLPQHPEDAAHELALDLLALARLEEVAERAARVPLRRRSLLARARHGPSRAGSASGAGRSRRSARSSRALSRSSRAPYFA